MAYMGTHVTGGSGRGVVVATAKATELGQIQTMVGEAEAPETGAETSKTAEPKSKSTASKAPASKSAESKAPSSKPPMTSAPQKTPPPAQRGGRILLITLAVVALAAIGYRYMAGPQTTQQQAATQAAPPPDQPAQLPVSVQL